MYPVGPGPRLHKWGAPEKSYFPDQLALASTIYSDTFILMG